MAVRAGVVLAVWGAALAFDGCRGDSVPEPKPSGAASATVPRAIAGLTAVYTTQVQPIFRANCYRCHAGLNHRGGLSMETRAGLLRGGRDGSVLVPGHPEQSLLVQLIRQEGPAGKRMPMPPKSRLPDAEIAAIEGWIRSGAPMPADVEADQ